MYTTTKSLLFYLLLICLLQFLQRIQPTQFSLANREYTHTHTNHNPNKIIFKYRHGIDFITAAKMLYNLDNNNKATTPNSATQNKTTNLKNDDEE